MVRLELDWPSTLVGWDKREHEATDDLGRYTPRDSCPHPILIIDLALELGLYHILPSAFYDLSRYGPSKILAGTSLRTVSVLSASTVEPDSEISNTCLSQHFLCKVFLGRESSQRYVGTFIHKELKSRPIAADCTNKGDSGGRLCRESFYYIMLNILRSVGGIACGRDGDPLFTLVQATDMLSRTDFSDGVEQRGLKICNPCKTEFSGAVTRAREEVWTLVPAWFGLDALGGIKH